MPGIKGVWKMPGGGSRFINVIAIEQLHPGHAKMAGLVAVGCGSSAYLGRIIIIVDDDIDITNPAEVMWAVATRWDPKTQTDIIDGCWTGYIDPMLPPERARDGRPDQQPHHHLRGAAVPLEGRVPQGQHGRAGLRRRGQAQMGRQARLPAAAGRAALTMAERDDPGADRRRRAGRARARVRARLRGIDCLLVEKRDGVVKVPKMSAVSARNMEFCRRWGIADDGAQRGLVVEPLARLRLSATTCAGWNWRGCKRPVLCAAEQADFSPEGYCHCPQIYFDPILVDARARRCRA